ncbi:MAG: hypothetical protein K6E16_09310 [Lachnospiraceae bacterium]|nr:hypothetical protein [Lachnospiraceae bacterium]
MENSETERNHNSNARILIVDDMDGVDTLVELKEIFRRSGAETPVICHTADEEKKKHIDQELSLLPVWIKNVSALDCTSGIEHCDTAADYVDALSGFCRLHRRQSRRYRTV